MSSGNPNREAVTQQSPGLPRVAATLGNLPVNDRNPKGVVSVSQFKER